jgi:hypothetical protein
MNMGDQISSIAPGMQADITAFDGDPLKDVNAALRPVFVTKIGGLAARLAIPPFETLTGGVASLITPTGRKAFVAEYVFSLRSRGQ